MLIEELDRAVKVPGLANFWIPPIRNRIDMLSAGIKSPIGIKVAGSNLAEIDRSARLIEQVAKTVPGVGSALAERLTGGRYIDVQIDRAAAARYGMNIADVQSIVSGAIGGETIGQTVEGLARYPISVVYPRELRAECSAATTALFRDANGAERKTLADTVLAYSKEQTLYDRSWLLNLGFESPQSEIPPIEQLLASDAAASAIDDSVATG